MRPVAFVVPGSIETRTGGSIYNRRMAEGLRQRGWSVQIAELDAGFPYPTGAALEHASRVLGAIRSGTIVLVDSLVLSAVPDLIEREAKRLPIVALVHLPVSADRSLDRDAAARFEEAERRALGVARLVVVTGTAARPLIERFRISPSRTVVVEPGTDRAPLARGSGAGPLTLLTVATLNPGKGHVVLLGALAAIRDLAWRSICAGSLTRHAATADRVRALAAQLKLDERVSLVGDLDAGALAGWYDRADIFVLASLQETYGMAVAEALARGLPVIATTAGAIPELVGDTAGILVPPGDVRALAEAIARALSDAALRARLAEGARRVRDELRNWTTASAELAGVLERV